MDTSTWLAQTTKRLEKAGIESARLDATVLLEDISGKDRAWLLANPDFHIEDAGFHKLEELIARREKHEPLAYIREKSEFYGREFAVNSNVLVPRPETESMIEVLKDIANGGRLTADGNWNILDVGTGSGALAITTKLEFPKAQVFALDIDPECLTIAQANAKALKATVIFLHGNLLEPLQSTVYYMPTIILANLPYVPDSQEINRAAGHEPARALFGGADGLDLYRTMFSQANTLATKPVHIITEAQPDQHAALASIAQIRGYQLADTKGYAQHFNVTL